MTSMTANRDASATQGFEFIRRTDKTPDTFFVMGERCSGTNYLQWVTRRNLSWKPVDLTFWKHGFPAFDVIPETMVVLVSYRNAVSWVRSLYTSPWHTSAQMQTLDFSAFLRCPWETVIDGRFMRRKYKGTPMIGLPLQMDRDPVTGEVFENLFRMRTAKLRALEGLRNRGCNVIYARQEDVVKDTEGFLDGVCTTFGISRKQRSVVYPDKRLGGWPGKMKRTAPDAMSDEDLTFLRSQLDLELETRLGYHY